MMNVRAAFSSCMRYTRCGHAFAVATPIPCCNAFDRSQRNRLDDDALSAIPPSIQRSTPRDESTAA